MIQSQELKIGNWIECDGQYVQVCAIIDYPNKKAISAKNNKMIGGLDCYELDTEKFSPISLSPSILEKCEGFVPEYEGASSWQIMFGKPYVKGTIIITINPKYNRMQVSIGTGGDETEWIYLPLPKSLHQLQNLIFSLTGTELTINL